MRHDKWDKWGTVTVLVDVPGLGGATTGFSPLVLTGTIVDNKELPRDCDHCNLFPQKIDVDGKITERETFLILRVTGAILPPGFPLTIAQLTTNIAINLDYIVLILPVAAS